MKNVFAGACVTLAVLAAFTEHLPIGAQNQGFVYPDENLKPVFLQSPQRVAPADSQLFRESMPIFPKFQIPGDVFRNHFYLDSLCRSRMRNFEPVCILRERWGKSV